MQKSYSFTRSLSTQGGSIRKLSLTRSYCAKRAIRGKDTTARRNTNIIKTGVKTNVVTTYLHHKFNLKKTSNLKYLKWLKFTIAEVGTDKRGFGLHFKLKWDDPRLQTLFGQTNPCSRTLVHWDFSVDCKYLIKWFHIPGKGYWYWTAQVMITMTGKTKRQTHRCALQKLNTSKRHVVEIETGRASDSYICLAECWGNPL